MVATISGEAGEMKQGLQHAWRDSLRNWLIHQWAGGGYPTFLSLTAVVVTLCVLAFAGLFYAQSLPGTAFWPCIERAFISFVTLEGVDGQCVGGRPVVDGLLEMILLFLALFFFAAVVAYFTALVVRPKRLLHFKSVLNVVRDARGCHGLVCSVYAAPVTITGLGIRIIARVRVNATTIRNVVMRDHPPNQPLAEPYIPLRLRADLEQQGFRIVGVTEDHFVSRVIYHDERKARELPVEEFYVVITGVMGDVDQSVYGERRYVVAERQVYFGSYSSVEPDYAHARCQSGWRKCRPPASLREAFEANAEPLSKVESACYVFGYGSLVDPASFARTLRREDWSAEDFPLARLKGYRRIWRVAMDNREAIPGYKQYFAPGEDTPPEVYVAYLDIEREGEGEMVGVLARVSEEELSRLKARERNYVLHEISDALLDAPCGGRVFTFVGSEAGRERFSRGLSTGTAVISRSYLRAVEDAFRRRGATAWENYRQSTQSPADAGLRILDLQRRRVPPGDG